jgi:hypothetical protein
MQKVEGSTLATFRGKGTRFLTSVRFRISGELNYIWASLFWLADIGYSELIMVMSTLITSKSYVSVFPQPLYGTESAFTSAE